MKSFSSHKHSSAGRLSVGGYGLAFAYLRTSLRSGSRVMVLAFALASVLSLAAGAPVGSVSDKGRGAEYLEKTIGKFDGIKDYIVDVKVHMDMKAVQMPDMEATIYFKEPDKIKIDSKGFFVLPKDVGVINPRKFSPDKYEIAVVDSFMYDGDPAVRLSLVPKSDESGNRNILLTIDTRKWLIVEIGTAPYPGREASAKVKYGTFDGYQMPVEVKVHLDVKNMNGEGRAFGHRRMDQLNGNVDIQYSNYKINTNIPDKIFEKKNRD